VQTDTKFENPIIIKTEVKILFFFLKKGKVWYNATCRK